MHISYFHFLIFLSAILLSTTDAQRVITSPGTCLRDSDCDEFSEYCTSNYECRKRGKKNSECFRNVECSHGLYCGEVNDRRVCVAQNALFEKCDHSFENPCAVDGRFTYKCSPVSNTCEYTGFDGSTCFGISDCQIGSYCKDAGNINGGKCSPKLRDGERCDLTGDSWECEGFCATGNFDDFEGGVCVFGSTFGEPCTQNDHCNGYATAVNDPNSLGVSSIICNVAKGNTGVCEHERDLIKKEGIKCNPAKDTCDYERGLSCRSTPTGPKCMFNKFDSDVGGPRFCDINGNLSKCNLLQGTPSECRRDFDDSSPFGNQYKEFFKCQRKTETIPHGLPCNNVGFSVCEQGTTCMFVPGVLQRSRKFSRQTKFCVKVKKEGEKCYSKFKFACENGLKCENNVCVKGKPDETITHGFETISCESQSCAPGLECVESFGFKSCQFKKIEKSKGACFQTALTGTVSIQILSSFFFLSQYFIFFPVQLFTNFLLFRKILFSGLHWWYCL